MEKCRTITSPTDANMNDASNKDVFSVAVLSS